MRESAFTSAQYAEAYPDGIEAHYWHRARNRLVLEALRRLSANRVLEIGCGRGIVVQFLRRHGIDCSGVELSPYPAGVLLDSHIRTGVDCFELVQEERGAPDSLLLLDVIEHVDDPVGFMANIREAFPNAKQLVVTVPARGELWSNYDDHYGHLRRYERIGLAKDIAAAGFAVKQTEYFFHALYPPAWLASRVAGRRSTTLSAPSFAISHRMIEQILLIEQKVLPGWLWGTSLLAIAERGEIGLRS